MSLGVVGRVAISEDDVSDDVKYTCDVGAGKITDEEEADDG